MRSTLRSLAILTLCLPVPWGACNQEPPGAPASASGVAVQISPSSASVAVGAYQSFSVTVSGTDNTAVVWSVNGIPGGNSQVGMIQPTPTGAQYLPVAVPPQNPVTVAATSQANTRASAASTVTVQYPNDTAGAQSFPIKLGTSGGNVTNATPTACCSGTLGCLVERDGAFFILSNNHVLNGSVGDAVSQPGLVDTQCRAGAEVASLTQAAALQTSNVDAAFAQIAPGAVDLSGAILDLGPIDGSKISPAPPSATLADPAMVMASNPRVAKSGRSTGLTCGTLQSIHADLSVQYSSACNGPAAFTVTFRNQLVIDGAAFSESGDSGSLIVTSDSSRPLGLLYAGSGQTTAANPIADVLAALKSASTGTTPRIVGGGDHPVSCAPTTPASKSLSVEPLESAGALAAKEKFGPSLLEDPAVTGLGIGSSADHPGEATLLIYLKGRPKSPLPRQLDGVRTRLVGLEPAEPQIDALQKALEIKERHSAALFQKNAVLGVGIGKSLDAEGEPALVLYVERGQAFAGVEAELEGVRTRVIEVDRFRAYGWGQAPTPGSSCCGTPR